MLFAVIQDACFFGGAVQETVMVLDGGNGKSAFCQDFLRSLDFSKVMIGNADFPDLSALGERNEVLRPAFDVHRVVDPVDIHVVRVKTGEASLQHLFHGVIPGACNLRGEFRGNEDIFSWHILHEIAQDSFGRSFSVDGCCVLEGQSLFHGFIKNGTEVVLEVVISENLVSASHAGAPRPCAQCEGR